MILCSKTYRHYIIIGGRRALEILLESEDKYPSIYIMTK